MSIIKNSKPIERFKDSFLVDIPSVKLKGCPNCAQNDFEDVDLKHIKCTYCGSIFEDAFIVTVEYSAHNRDFLSESGQVFASEHRGTYKETRIKNF